MNRPPLDGRLLDELVAEIARQDQSHPAGFPATRDGVFHGINTAIWELEREALDAWQQEKRDAEWRDTRMEMIQAAAVIMRTVRSVTDTVDGDVGGVPTP